MKTFHPLLLLLSAGVASAQPSSNLTAGERPPITQILTNQPPVTGRHDVTLLGDEQKLYAASTDSVVSPEQAQAVVEKFRSAYGKLGSPRLLFYINRELVDVEAGLRLAKRTERTEAVRGETKSDVEPAAPASAPQTQVNVSVSGDAGPAGATLAGTGSTESKTERIVAENTYEAPAATKGTLADRQTVRDVERLFGRPFRAAGAMLADQRVAATLIADRPMDHASLATGELARKDREALTKVADVVIEVLISSRQVVVPQVAGDKILAVPDIQATAIRLRDSAILGQASSRDVLGKDRDAGRIASRYDASDIAEATALALMEDMSLAGK